MAPVPKKRHTRARTGKRRGNIKLSVPNLSKCANCGELKKSHMACPNCGKTAKEAKATAKTEKSSQSK